MVDSTMEYTGTAGESTIDVGSLEAWLGVVSTEEPAPPGW